MSKLSEALKLIIKDPDDLTNLPAIIAQVETLETQEEGYLARIGKLTALNKQYLNLIPMPGEEQEEQEQIKEPSIEDATAYLIDAYGGN